MIPTRNRPESLHRLIASLAAQERLPDEVIIVDASDQVDEHVRDAFGSKLHRIEVVRTRPHLCLQRNEGIRLAAGSHVLLCDDDVELPPHYLRRLVHHLESHPEDGAVTGPFRDRNASGVFGPSFPVPSTARLLWSFLFQLSVWGDVEGMRPSRGPASFALHRARAFYRRRGNTWSLAGWPLVTQVRSDVVHTAVYTLGAALVRRDWLLASPYDDRLDPHGIGDHYGVALGFPRCPGVALLTDLEVMHHRAQEERLAEPGAYFARILALDLFTRESPRFRAWSRAFLVWSLIGSSTFFALRGKWAMLGRAFRAILAIVFGTNPLRNRPGVTSPVTGQPA